tara:strand:+ start:558 stop:1142 length:585 start_codon:yes stop_codon:yes gene_type:complete
MERQVDSTNQMETTIGVTALAVIDLQPVFLDMMSNAKQFRRRCSLLLETAELLGVRTYLTEQVPDKLGAFDEELAGLAPSAKCFAKSSFSAFGAESFEETLRSQGVEHLLLAGVETSICVYQTALDARRSGLAVTTLTDCVSCRRPTDGHWAMKALLDAGCHALSLETVFYALLGDARNPCFRDFSKLVQRYDA